MELLKTVKTEWYDTDTLGEWNGFIREWLHLKLPINDKPYCSFFPKKYPIKNYPGPWKPLFTDFNQSITYRFNRACWPIISLSKLSDLPLDEITYNYFYITFIDIPLNPAPLRNLRFAFWTDKSNRYFHEMVNIESEFNPDYTILRLLGSYSEPSFSPAYLFEIDCSDMRCAKLILEHCKACGEKLSLFV